MAFKSFDTNQTGDNQSLPWFEEYVKSDSSIIGQTVDVSSIRLTQKGMMIITRLARGFIYKSHVSHDHVLEFIKAWSGRKEKSPILQVLVTDMRPYINLGVEDTRHGIWSVGDRDSWSQAYATVDDNPLTSPSVNPFPLPSPDTSVLSDSLTEEGIVSQTSQERPLEASGNRLNGVKRTKTSKSS